jgi:hypothetical protein
MKFTSIAQQWTDNEETWLKTPVSKGQRVIVVHAGDEEGFIPNALMMFKSSSKSGDYHGDVNCNNYNVAQGQINPKFSPRIHSHHQ